MRLLLNKHFEIKKKKSIFASQNGQTANLKRRTLSFTIACCDAVASVDAPCYFFCSDWYPVLFAVPGPLPAPHNVESSAGARHDLSVGRMASKLWRRHYCEYSHIFSVAPG